MTDNTYAWIRELGLNVKVRGRREEAAAIIRGDGEIQELVAVIPSVLWSHMGVDPDKFIGGLVTEEQYLQGLVGLGLFLHDYLEKRGQ